MIAKFRYGSLVRGGCAALVMLAAVATVPAQQPEKRPAKKPDPAAKSADAAAPAAEADAKAGSPKSANSAQKPAKDAKRPVDAAKPDAAKPDADKAESRKPGRAATAKAFAREHHPELVALLKTLEAMSPPAYDAAIRDVARAADRLNEMKERDPQKYAVELELWKTRSRVHVVSAEYRVSPGSELAEKLRGLLQDELRAKRAALAYERERAEQRIEQIDRQIAELHEQGDSLIERRIESLPKLPVSTKQPAKKP